MQIVNILFHTLKHSVSITIFVASMMLIIDVINVITKGDWQDRISKIKFIQYMTSSLFGSTPGCLGAFTVVSMYTHKILGMGAVVAAMIATSGDEAFVMFAMFPKMALFMTLLLLIIGIISGWLTDILLPKFNILSSQDIGKCKKGFEFHKEQEQKEAIFSKNNFKYMFLHPYKLRLILLFIIFLVLLSFVLGFFEKNWNWVRITFLVLLVFNFIILLFVSNHFISEHLWKHVFKKHIPSIFAWTWGTLLVLALINVFNLTSYISGSGFILLILAVLIGILPQSGPHLIFVTMYAQGLAPFSILLASSISQDGHGSIPLLAHSRRDFIIVKLINVLVAFIVGGILFVFGY